MLNTKVLSITATLAVLATILNSIIKGNHGLVLILSFIAVLAMLVFEIIEITKKDKPKKSED